MVSLKTVRLIRQPSTDMGTPGKLYTDNRGYYTGELPWRNNEQSKSCVPIGPYIAKWLYSPHHNRYNYHLQDVKHRTDVEIHSGNYFGNTDVLRADGTEHYRSDVEGCILLGFNCEMILGQLMLTGSRAAIAEFEKEMAQEDFQLIISEEGQP